MSRSWTFTSLVSGNPLTFTEVARERELEIAEIVGDYRLVLGKLERTERGWAVVITNHGYSADVSYFEEGLEPFPTANAAARWIASGEARDAISAAMEWAYQEAAEAWYEEQMMYPYG